MVLSIFGYIYPSQGLSETHPKYVFYVSMEWKDFWSNPIQSCLGNCLPPQERGWARPAWFWSLEQTLCLKLLWLLFVSGSSLWAIWMKSNRIKEDNVWNCDVEKVKSWTWCSLLHLRSLASRFIRAKIGNGHLISFWWNVWMPYGKLIEYFGPDGAVFPFKLPSPTDGWLALTWGKVTFCWDTSNIPYYSSSAFTYIWKGLLRLACQWLCIG